MPGAEAGERLAAIGAAGMNVDLEELQPEDSENFLELLVDLRNALHARSMRLTVDVPFHDPAFDFEYIGDVADAVMVMAYDQHYPASRPGQSPRARGSRSRTTRSCRACRPTASSWCWATTATTGASATTDRAGRGLVVPRGHGPRARRRGAAACSKKSSRTATSATVDHSGETHEVWFQDALATWNQVTALQARHITRVGLWRLGTEDETLWSFLGAETPTVTAPRCSRGVPPVKSVGLFGEGENLHDPRRAAVRRARADHRARRHDRRRGATRACRAATWSSAGRQHRSRSR